MKKIIAVIFLFQVTLICAGGLPNVAIEPEIPVAGQNINVMVLSSICPSPQENVVEIEGNTIRVFIRFVGTSCPSPLPPPYLMNGAELAGLNEGVYNLQYYMLRELDDLPPLPSDYPLFFVEEIQFQVLGNGGPTAVDATSTVSLLILLVLMFSMCAIFIKRS